MVAFELPTDGCEFGRAVSADGVVDGVHHSTRYSQEKGRQTTLIHGWNPTVTVSRPTFPASGRRCISRPANTYGCTFAGQAAARESSQALILRTSSAARPRTSSPTIEMIPAEFFERGPFLSVSAKVFRRAVVIRIRRVLDRQALIRPREVGRHSRPSRSTTSYCKTGSCAAVEHHEAGFALHRRLGLRAGERDELADRDDTRVGQSLPAAAMGPVVLQVPLRRAASRGGQCAAGQ